MEDRLLDPDGRGRGETGTTWQGKVKGVYYDKIHNPVMNVLKV